MKIKIQPKERPDMTLPYPYFIDVKTGEVGKQDFWKGEPLRLVGFNPKPDTSGENTLVFKDFVKDPKQAVGMFPVFEHSDGNYFTYQDPIEWVIKIKD